jgi:RNA polymerase sigma-70 factor, ECF subfamily
VVSPRRHNVRPREQKHSFEALAQELGQPLLRYLRRLVGDQTVADDLLQETLVRIARGLSAFSGRSSAKTWAYSIATNVAADHFRKVEHRLNIVEVSEAGDLPDADRSADERMVVDEMNSCVRQVIDSLPDDYRTALVLHELEGLTMEHTAEICGCSLATAKIRIHRGRERLRKALHEACDFYRDSDSVLRCDRKT